MGSLSAGLAPEWLALREKTDANARAASLLGPLLAWLRARAESMLVVRDLGCGTGSMGRWLAGRLPGAQHWILHDRDPELLARALGEVPGTFSVRAELGDVTMLGTADLAGTSLLTASALLDLLTGAEIEALALVCAEAGCPALLTLSVLGRVEFDPVDPLDEELVSAFNDHQRRRGRAGSDAFSVACAAFSQHSLVYKEMSPWRLGPSDAVLIEEWLRGWVSAAGEQYPELAEAGRHYLRRRLKENAAGMLRVAIGHGDLLALPKEAP
jgi:hypothetical protein